MLRILCFFLLGSPFFALAQEHTAPPKGANGIPGTVPGSFVIKWAEVPGALAYEYVLTNNELCFANCPGDTRQATVATPEAVEYDLQDSTFYFWITRVIFSGGDTSNWTLPSYFLATTPDLSRPVAVAAPEPEASLLQVRLDWSALADAEHISLEILDPAGRQVYHYSELIRRQGVSQRFTRRRLPFAPAQGGYYILRARILLRSGGEQAALVKFAWW